MVAKSFVLVFCVLAFMPRHFCTCAQAGEHHEIQQHDSTPCACSHDDSCLLVQPAHPVIVEKSSTATGAAIPSVIGGVIYGVVGTSLLITIKYSIPTERPHVPIFVLHCTLQN